MYFGYRPSGGRGEYEVAGTYGDLRTHDLLEWTFWIDAGPLNVIKETDLMLIEQGGKPRLRTTANVPQIQMQIGALLLLPESTRDHTKVSHGLPVIIEKRYVIDRLPFRSMDLDQANEIATVSLGTISVKSADDLEETFAFDTRMARVIRAHDGADDLPEQVADALRKHADACAGTGAVGNAAKSAVKQVMNALVDTGDYIYGTDPLPAIELLLDPTAVPLPETDDIEVVPADLPELRRREASRMRMAKTRGASAARFRKEVQTAYNFRCLVCGLRLPKTEHCTTPGVDAAHIVPWAAYDVDDVRNGICLCKLHHWAFDQQMIVLEFDGTDYLVQVPVRAELALADDPESLAELCRFEGPVPAAHLPVAAKRPAPAFLDEFYDKVPAT